MRAIPRPLMSRLLLVHVINFLQEEADRAHTAVIIAYDDSDGWYDWIVCLNPSSRPT